MEKTPIPNKGFKSIIEYKWGRLWEEWEERNPGFFKRFYEKLGEQKQNGLVQIDKGEIITLAESITPGFLEWIRKEAKPLMDLGENEEHSMAKAIRVNPLETDIIQYHMVQAYDDRFASPYWIIEGFMTGPIISWQSTPSWIEGGQAETQYIANIDPHETNKVFLIVQQNKGNKQVIGWSIGDSHLDY